MKYLKFNLLFVALLLLAACNDNNEPTSTIIPTLNLTVSDMVENSITIQSEQGDGVTFGAKILNYYPISDIDFDYNIEVKLVKFVEEMGTPATLPYKATISEGLKPGIVYITAIIAYNKEGRAVCSAFKTWKATGTEGMWTEGSSAGNLESNEW